MNESCNIIRASHATWVSLVQLYTQRERWEEALPYVRRLAELVPDNPRIQAFVSQVEQRAQ